MSKEPQQSDRPETPRGDQNGGSGKPDRSPPPPPKMSRGFAGLFLLLGALIIVVILLTNAQSRGVQIDTWRQFRMQIQEDRIVPDSIIIRSNRIEARIKPGTPGFDASDERGTMIYFSVNPDLIEHVYAPDLKELTGGEWRDYSRPNIWVQFLLYWGPFLIIFLIILFLITRSFRSAAAGPGGMLGSFGKSRHRVSSKDNVSVTLNDVAGVDEAKEEVAEIVEFLKNPKKFQRLGGRIPRGVLLVGPPGCGKTLLAKAIAGEADVPFFSISGSDFVEMFVGVGASRVRDLFKQAKDNSPCIIFLDEIDAVGRRRGSGFSSGGHDEREQTLNAILVEMDGFEANDQVIVIAATNRADVLDSALTRPGRFDRQVMVSLPDVEGRFAILKVHAKKVKLGPDVDLERLARGTPMFSGADLAAIINEAAIIATMAEKDFIEMEDLDEARDKVRFGRANKSRKIEQEERVATAYHEAGHTVVQHLLKDADPLHKVTIIPRGQAMGATFSLPEKDRYGYGRKWILATMQVMCGGRIAEEKKTGDVSSGAAMDIKQVTTLARHMILEWGMSEKLGFVNYAGADTREMFIPERGYSDDTARLIDEEIKQFADTAYEQATELLEQHWDQVVAIAEALLRYETLQADDVDRLMRGERLDKPTVAELLSAEANKPKPAPQQKPAKDDEEGPQPAAWPSPA